MSRAVPSVARRAAVRGYRWWRDTDERHDERSNSMILIILALPMLVAAFGLGADVAKNTFLRTQIQSNLDQATASAASVTRTLENPSMPGSYRVLIDLTPARATARQVYALNRKDHGGLKCTGPRTPVAGTSEVFCWRELGRPPQPGSVDWQIRYEVIETAPNFFLNSVGLDEQDFRVKSVARVAPRNG